MSAADRTTSVNRDSHSDVLKKPHLLVCFSGSVASIKATMLVRQLKEFAEVLIDSQSTRLIK